MKSSSIQTRPSNIHVAGPEKRGMKARNRDELMEKNFIPPILRNRSSSCKVECLHLCRGGGSITGLAAVGGMVWKRQRKRTPDWPVHSSRLCNGNEQQAATEETALRNRQGTFTQAAGQPSGRLGTAIVSGLGGVKRGVWERYGQAAEVF